MKDFFLAAIQDPNTKNLSLTRSSGAALVIAGIVFAFLHPDQSGMAAALLGGGGLSFFTRTKTSPEA